MGEACGCKALLERLAGQVLTGLVIVCVVLFPAGDSSPGQVDAGDRFCEEEWESFREYGEKLLEEALMAYNREDYEGFTVNFSERRFISERAFTVLWAEDHKKEFGNFVSWEFSPGRSNPVKNYPLLTYKAVFVRNDEVGIRCVFTMDPDGQYRIMYLRFDPYEDLYY